MSRKRVFLDTNVVLDFILDREQFAADAQQLFYLHEMEELEIYVSSLTLATTAYIVKSNGRNSFQVIKELLSWVEVVNLEVAHFQKATVSSFKDFEDALQYFIALDVKGIEVIVTRNKGDFKPSNIPVLTPIEFIKSLNS